ncbi:NADH-quinone oxidoreductase subunit J [Peribacillus cavernae]|uniref:NADH-quinone oxidoreductase subunit J n=1 Tax=Peribacillus cavernae TaxID=1674310 RepID=A0A433HT41_9BACI|nr:NADH-quinone oxidoreductase subunit J [Peribacillus cavernae]MDQ0218496.1 NADH-quinone oxidoreductase subunit J [Peribacillus cavernae]RUQ31490.1 NADH-quinone oxidoreductase subunit J [Peribacillus cavernae]
MSLSGEFLAFIVLSLVAIIGGVLLLNLTKVVHMVIALVFSFISIAGIYVLLSAEFIAAVQVLIYSGAITIIMLFGIMLTRHHDTEDIKTNTWKRLILLLAIVGFGFVVYIGIYNLDIPEKPTTLHEANTEQIGIELYSKYIIPFEVTSVILLVALVGAIILAKKDHEEEGDNS